MNRDELFNLRDKIYIMSSKTEKQRRQEVLENILTQKLDRSYNNYAEMITSKINYILSRNNYKVIKALNRMKKEQENNMEEDDLDE